MKKQELGQVFLAKSLLASTGTKLARRVFAMRGLAHAVEDDKGHEEEWAALRIQIAIMHRLCVQVHAIAHRTGDLAACVRPLL